MFCLWYTHLIYYQIYFIYINSKVSLDLNDLPVAKVDLPFNKDWRTGKLFVFDLASYTDGSYGPVTGFTPDMKETSETDNQQLAAETLRAQIIFKFGEVAAHDRLQGGVQGGGRTTLELSNLR